MIRYVLQFCLTPPKTLPPEKREKWGKEWDAKLKPLTIWMTTLGDCQVDLTARGDELLKFLQDAKKAGGGIASPLELYEQVIDDKGTPVEWYILSPDYMGDVNKDLNKIAQETIRDYREILNVKADKMKPGVNVSGWITGVFVSERFK